jgi:hypothetical protein
MIIAIDRYDNDIDNGHVVQMTVLVKASTLMREGLLRLSTLTKVGTTFKKGGGIVTSKPTHHGDLTGRQRATFGSRAARSRAVDYINPENSLITPQGFVLIQASTYI